MKIHLDIEADSPEDLEVAIRGLAKTLGGVTSVAANITEPAQAIKTEDVQKVEVPARRGRPPKAKVEEAKPAPEPEPTPEEAEAVEEADDVTEEPKVVETKPLTEEEVRQAILDLLSGWAEVRPNDPDIRRKKLEPLLAKFGAGKIKELFEKVDKADWGNILDAVAEANEELAAAQRAASEE